MPASNQWLKLMARNFTPQTQIVLGYSGYDRTKDGCTNVPHLIPSSNLCVIWDSL